MTTMIYKNEDWASTLYRSNRLANRCLKSSNIVNSKSFNGEISESRYWDRNNPISRSKEIQTVVRENGFLTHTAKKSNVDWNALEDFSIEMNSTNSNWDSIIELSLGKSK